MHSDLIVMQSGFILLCGLYSPTEKLQRMLAVGHWSAFLRRGNGNDNNAQERQSQKHGTAKLIGGVGICYAKTMHNSIIPH